MTTYLVFYVSTKTFTFNLKCTCVEFEKPNSIALLFNNIHN